MGSRPKSADFRLSKSSSAPNFAIQYQWDASIPYNWRTISDVPLVKVRPCTSLEKNAYETLFRQREWMGRLCRPPSGEGRTGEKGRKGGRRERTGAISLTTKRSRDNPATVKILNLSFHLKPKICLIPFPTYSFPKSQPRKSPLKSLEVTRSQAFKNRNIESYLGRFERNKGSQLSRVRSVGSLGR